jgi:23S rRNA (cytidine1920-2'-O)/16S rRNA (cytidine1409-2'-O)-methyltransferase
MDIGFTGLGIMHKSRGIRISGHQKCSWSRDPVYGIHIFRTPYAVEKPGLHYPVTKTWTPPSGHESRSDRMKLRLDKLLVDRQLAASRERAQALILAGRVLVAEQRVDKPGHSVADDAVIRVLGDDLKYVSRGGLKLEGALETWGIAVDGLVCADIGASTGGFTDCMLQRGAASVLAVDTGYGQIHNKLRADARVTLMERTNARLLAPGALATHAIRFFTMDVSFIGVSLVLPGQIGALTPAGERWTGEAVILVKPQFEAGREWVGKGGIVRDPAGHQIAVHRVEDSVRALGGQALALIDSPILGMEGNREFLLHARFGG